MSRKDDRPTFEVWVPDHGEGAEDAETVHGYDHKSVAAERFEAKHGDWDYPEHMTLRVRRVGESAVYEIEVAACPDIWFNAHTSKLIEGVPVPEAEDDIPFEDAAVKP